MTLRFNDRVFEFNGLTFVCKNVITQLIKAIEGLPGVSENPDELTAEVFFDLCNNDDLFEIYRLCIHKIEGVGDDQITRGEFGRIDPNTGEAIKKNLSQNMNFAETAKRYWSKSGKSKKNSLKSGAKKYDHAKRG